MKQFLIDIKRTILCLKDSPFTHLLIFCTVLISVWGHSDGFTDSHILPKWLFGLIGALLIVCQYAAEISLNRVPRIHIPFIAGCIVAVVSLQAIFGILQYVGLLSSPSLYSVTGSFDNPAGFASCLCIGFPFVGFLLSEQKRYLRCGGGVLLVIITIAVVLSASRAGVVSIAVMGLVWLLQKMTGKYKAGRYVLLATFAVLLVVCYWMKKDSADGRLLIWQCSVEQAKEAPLFGHGPGSCEKHYMDFQASYFKKHGTDNQYAMLADNVKHPFNEYLNVLLSFGLFGWMVLAGLIVWLIRCYKKHPDREKCIVAYALLSIGTFSLFSYPFSYPFTWIVALLCVSILAKEQILRLFSFPKVRYIICAAAFIGSLVGIYKWTERVTAELEWNKASDLAAIREYETALPVYQELRDKFADNPYFLYNYAAVLSNAGLHEESLKIALLCRHYWADYDLELIIGENYQQLGHPVEAEIHYRRAALMCPLRFLPLYKLLHLYEENGDEPQMIKTADEIIAKSVKIESPAVLMMKREAARKKKRSKLP